MEDASFFLTQALRERDEARAEVGRLLAIIALALDNIELEPTRAHMWAKSARKELNLTPRKVC